MSTKPHIFFFGPHDRFNYGDLLFVIVLDYAIKKLYPHHLTITRTSLVDADLSDRGGFRSLSYRKLKRKIKTNDILIITGGECLKAKTKILLSYNRKWYNDLVKRPKIYNLIKGLQIEKYLFGIRSENPYCVSREDFPASLKIIYNSVGGGVHLSSRQLHDLDTSDYLSVRDERSFNYLLDKIRQQVFLVPDSVIILSDVYPKDEVCSLNFIKNTKIKKFLNSQPRYIFFQISKERSRGKILQIVQQLEYIHKQTGYKIVLCPIGTALGHEDQVALKKIYNQLNADKFFVEMPSLQEILSLLIQAEIYIGSSLHGVITSMSYGIPYIALDKRQSKVRSYLATWSIEELKQIAETVNFAKPAIQAIEKHPYLNQKTLSHSEVQKELYYQSVKRIVSYL